MLESMFGDFDLDDLHPQQLETDATKNLHQDAGQAEEASVSKEHGAIPKDKITQIVVRTTPVPLVFLNLRMLSSLQPQIQLKRLLDFITIVNIVQNLPKISPV